MSDAVLLGKLGFAVAGFVASIVLVLWRRTYAISTGRFTTESFLLLVASRLGAFIAIFFVLRLVPQSDVMVYYDWTVLTLRGGLPSREFPLAYGPLFTYVCAAAVWLWHSPLAIVMLAIILEAASFPFWLAVGRSLFAETTVRAAAMLYITSPIALYNAAVIGQNQVWIAAFLAPALLLLIRHRDLASGLVLGMSVVVVKFLSMLFMPVLFIAARNHAKWGLGFMIPPVLAAGVCVALGWDLIEGPRYHGQHITAGNLPYLLTAIGLDLGDLTVQHAVDLSTLAALGMAFLVPVVRGRFRGPCAVHLVTIVLLTMLLMSKKSFSTYLAIAFFPFCLTLAARRVRLPDLLMFGFFGAVAMLEPSLWFRWLEERDLSLLSAAALPPGLDRAKIVAFAICEVALVGCYGWYLAHAFGVMREAPDTAERVEKPSSGNQRDTLTT